MTWVGAERLVVSESVGAELAAGRPVVALESTVIAHGLPAPHNLALAHDLERIVREGGATPATIALADGRIVVGADAGLLRRLAQEPATKVSLRDIGPVLARGALGATTVAATLFAAERAGIRVFATGGIGGVHRGAAATFDISTDLRALERHSCVVVCAGAKSILDLPATLEYLETAGVTVLGYRTDEFPAFYARESGLRLEERVETAAGAAEVARARWRAGLAGAVLLAVPVPEAAAIPTGEIEPALTEAERRAAAAGIAGKALTPFLLAALNEITAGHSLAANLALLRQNAALAAEVAVALAALERA